VAPETPGVTAESYWMPQRIVLSAWLEHAPFAAWVVAAVRPATLVELGTHNGFSFFTFCEAAERLGLDLAAYAIDTWEGDEHAGFYGQEIYDDVAAVAAAEHSGTAVLLRGYFDDFVDDFEDGSVDLLHIDGRHGYEDVKHDFESWLPKVSARGVVLFHDVAERERGFGVWRLWEEVRERYPSFLFEHEHGLGVIAVGADAPAALAPLFDADEDETRRIRGFYSARGALVTAARAKDVELERLGAEVEGLRGELGEAGAEAERLAARLDEARAERDRARGEADTIRTSYSWRITEPVRRALALVPAPGRAALRRFAGKASR
jgi:hypothetical protein